MRARSLFADPRRNRDDVLGTEDFCRHPFVCDDASFANCFFGEAGSGEKLNRKSFYEQVLALDSPAAFLQVRVDRRNAGGEPLLGRDENDIGVVGGEGFDVVDGGKSAAERVVFDQAGRD